MRQPQLSHGAGHSDTESPTSAASRYAGALLARWGRAAPSPRADPHPALDWARSGAMALSGEAGGPPRLAPGPLAAAARGALRSFGELAGAGWRAPCAGPELLGERAAHLGLSRRGRSAPGGSCRLLRAADGWLALNLAREDDRALLPAWLGEGDASDAWGFASERVARRPLAETVARARLLGLAVAPAAPPPRAAPPWLRVGARGPRARPARAGRPLVVDLSSLWAGPLCTQLLAAAGARVVKVESVQRPDAARAGTPAFFDRLHAGKESVALDFRAPRDRARLARLLQRTDIVVDSARPRALAQLGFDAAAWVAAGSGRTWLSLTGYGRRRPGADWVAFGDDAAVAAGATLAADDGSPLFCGDAIADPLTGLHAAVATLASWQAGGGHLLDLSLCDVVAHALAFGPGAGGAADVRAVAEGWEVTAGGECAAVRAPRALPSHGRARPFGADTDAVLAECAAPC